MTGDPDLVPGGTCDPKNTYKCPAAFSPSHHYHVFNPDVNRLALWFMVELLIPPHPSSLWLWEWRSDLLHGAASAVVMGIVST